MRRWGLGKEVHTRFSKRIGFPHWESLEANALDGVGYYWGLETVEEKAQGSSPIVENYFHVGDLAGALSSTVQPFSD